MTDRENEIIRAALIYMVSNLDDVNKEAFAVDPSDNRNANPTEISVNGDLMEQIAESEVEDLLRVFQ